jgi:cytochrome c553
MTEDGLPVGQPPTTEGTPEPQVQEPAVSVSPPVAETPTWLQELDKADPKTLRTHPRIAGIIGNEIQKAIADVKERIKADEGRRAAEEAEAKLRQLAEDDPATFAQQWLTEAQRNDLKRQLEDLRGKTRHELAEKVGQAMHDLPEWKELGDSDMQKVAEACAGKSDDEVIPIFNRTVLELAADRRAKKLFEQWKEKELGKEREAVRTEEAGKLLKGSVAPDQTPPKGTPAKVNVNEMSDAEFDKYWETRFKR